MSSANHREHLELAKHVRELLASGRSVRDISMDHLGLGDGQDVHPLVTAYAAAIDNLQSRIVQETGQHMLKHSFLIASSSLIIAGTYGLAAGSYYFSQSASTEFNDFLASYLTGGAIGVAFERATDIINDHLTAHEARLFRKGFQPQHDALDERFANTLDHYVAANFPFGRQD